MKMPPERDGIPEPVIGRQVFVGGVVLEREAPDRAEHASTGDLDREQSGQRRDERREAQHVIDGCDAAGAGSGRDDVAAAVDVDGERLLDEHVPAGSEGPDGEGGVGPRGCGDDDDVDVAIGEEPVEVGRDRGRWVVGGEADGEVLPTCRRRPPARRWELGDGVGEERAERAAPEQSEPMRRAVASAHARVRSRSATPMLLSAMP